MRPTSIRGEKRARKGIDITVRIRLDEVLGEEFFRGWRAFVAGFLPGKPPAS